MAQYPSQNDREFNLWKKIASNYYDMAVAAGITDLNPPAQNDSEFDLQKKVTYYTAALASV